MGPRCVEAEWLDQMPPDHPEVLENRRDLRVLNEWMGTHGWFEQSLREKADPTWRILELGAGDGLLARHLQGGGWRVDGLDPCPAPVGWPAERVWERTTVETFGGWGNYSVVVANLLLHQIEGPVLAGIGEKLQSARLLIFQEPWRSRWAQALFLASVPVLGLNRVSRHDGWVSIKAGFRGDELAEALRLTASDWDWSVNTTVMGVYRFSARRRVAD